MDVNFERAEKIWSPLIGKFIVDFVVIDDSIQHIISKHLSKLSKNEIKAWLHKENYEAISF